MFLNLNLWPRHRSRVSRPRLLHRPQPGREPVATPGCSGAALALVLLIPAFVWLTLRMQKQAPSASNQSSALTEEAKLGPPTGEEIRILAGSSRSFVDHAGKLWSADAWFDGGTAVKSSVQHIWRTQNPDFYRTSRQGQFRYAIPLKKGIYELRLHFAETVYGPESTGTGGEGSRLMTVRANGKTLLTRFDVVADAGASRTADVKVFTGIEPAADGLLHLEFAGEEGKQATALGHRDSAWLPRAHAAGARAGAADALLLQR